jgi:hypothetical protein
LETREVQKGTQVLIAAPREPMPRAQSAAIADMLSRVGGVTEAHLPHCFVPGVMEEPGLVLVLVLKRGTDAGRVVHDVTCGLAQLLTEGARLDVWPVEEGNSVLGSVRAVGCQILGARKKSWWRFW